MDDALSLSIGWAAVPTDVVWLAACADLLDAEESARAAAFRVEPARRQYVAAHALARRMLSTAVPDVRPRDWRFTRGPFGKPAVAGRAGLWFNLSHTDGLVACVVSTAGEVGVDVERRDRPVNIDDFAACLSPEERATFDGRPDAERAPDFFDVWTAKEAYLKARGTGLRPDLAAITVRAASSETPTIVATDSDAWHLRRWPVGDHTLVLASATATPPSLRPIEWTMDAPVFPFPCTHGRG